MVGIYASRVGRASPKAKVIFTTLSSDYLGICFIAYWIAIEVVWIRRENFSQGVNDGSSAGLRDTFPIPCLI